MCCALLLQAADALKPKRKRVRKARGRSKPTGVEGQKQVNFQKEAREKLAAKLAAQAREPARAGAGGPDSVTFTEDGVAIKPALSRFVVPK